MCWVLLRASGMLVVFALHSCGNRPAEHLGKLLQDTWLLQSEILRHPSPELVLSTTCLDVLFGCLDGVLNVPAPGGRLER